MAQPESVSEQFYFVQQTGNGRCGGTDADVYLTLYGAFPIRYPTRDSGSTAYILDRPRYNARERGKTDWWYLLSGTMDPVDTCGLTFSMQGDLPEWDLEWCRLVAVSYGPGGRRILRVLNHWQVGRCLDQDGYYAFGPTHDLMRKELPPDWKMAMDLLRNDNELFNSVLTFMLPPSPEAYDPLHIARERIAVPLIDLPDSIVQEMEKSAKEARA